MRMDNLSPFEDPTLFTGKVAFSGASGGTRYINQTASHIIPQLADHADHMRYMDVEEYHLMLRGKSIVTGLVRSQAILAKRTAQ